VDFFDYDDHGEMHAEGVSLTTVADAVGTPCYVYSYGTIRRHYEVFAHALASMASLICYSVKANTSQAILTLLASLGSGADIVSGGELHRALQAGIPAGRIVFSGVGKQAEEIRAALRAGILMLNVESEGELAMVESVARDLGVRAPISLRVNPDVDPKTHPYVATGLRSSKFGIPIEQARAVYEQILRSHHLVAVGVDCHIGSQLTAVDPFVDSVQRVLELAHHLRTQAGTASALQYLDVGGGLGIRYAEETPPSPETYATAVHEVLQRLGALDLTLICEPGRVIVGNAGVLLTRVLYLKDNGERRFVVVDAAMNDLIRPTLYGSFHQIRPVQRGSATPALVVVDVVGPVCESGDYLARDRPLEAVQPGDLLAVMSAGAYGYSMGSTYNSRARPPEVMVRDDQWAIIRPRGTLEDLVRGESVPEWVERA